MVAISTKAMRTRTRAAVRIISPYKGQREAYLLAQIMARHGRNDHDFNEHPRPPNRDQPIISQAVVHGNVAYFAGITPNPIVGDIKTQTAQVPACCRLSSVAKKCPRYW